MREKMHNLSLETEITQKFSSQSPLIINNVSIDCYENTELWSRKEKNITSHDACVPLKHLLRLCPNYTIETYWFYYFPIQVYLILLTSPGSKTNHRAFLTLFSVNDTEI